jgi:chromate transporter
VPFREAARFWLQLGLVSFGGPAGQIAIMHRELVERRRWISERRFLHALNYCMLLPGPEAQQLATYIGWLLHRSWGGIVAGTLFVLPSLLLLIGLSYAYMAYGHLPWLAGLFYGIKPAVTAIVLHAAWRIGTRTLRHPLLWALAAASFIAIFALQVPFPAIVATAAALGAVAGRLRPAAFAVAAPQHGPAGARPAATAPSHIDDDTPTPAHARHDARRTAATLAAGALLWALPMLLLLGWDGWSGIYTQMGWFFTKAALLTFGGAYAVLPYVYQGAVGTHGWLTAGQMIDGLALGETTPGPLIMVVAFVAFVGGYSQSPLGPGLSVASGALAAVLVTWFTFLPSFVFILVGGPLVESTHGNLSFQAPLTAITAAVVGVILNLAAFFAYHVFWPAGLSGPFDVVAALIGVLAAIALVLLKRHVIEVIGGCAAAGLIASLVR